MLSRSKCSVPTWNKKGLTLYKEEKNWFDSRVIVQQIVVEASWLKLEASQREV